MNATPPTPRFPWLAKLCYRFSMHAEVEKALHWMYATGYAAGQRDAQKRAIWAMPEQERHTDRIEQVSALPPPQKPPTVPKLPPGQWSRAVRHAPGKSLDSRILNAVNPAQQRLVDDVLSRRKPEQERKDV